CCIGAGSVRGRTWPGTRRVRLSCNRIVRAWPSPLESWDEKRSCTRADSRRVNTHRTGCEVAEREVADAFADQAQGRQADRGGHAPHLAVAALADRESQPGVRHVLAIADRRVAWPQPVRRGGKPFDGGRQGRSVVQQRTGGEACERIVIRLALD